MELHKPQGFVNGGPAMNFQQIAMGNQSKQNDQGIMQVANLMPDASAPVIPIQMKNLSDSDSELNQDAIMNAIEEGRQKAKKFQPKKLYNSIAASDAFFPFADGIEKLVQSGVRAVVQPSGSIRDKEIINFANETDTVLLFSKTRHFRH